MIEIKKEKIAEMMFGIWHESDNLKNPVMVGEYIANKIKEAINYTNCCMELKNGDCSCLIKYPNLGVDELKDCKKGFDYFNNKNKI